MKQNERLLVYAVTGFLALILVIAVLFGSDPVDASRKQESTSKGLSDLLDPKASNSALSQAQDDADAQAKALAERIAGSGGRGANLASNPIGTEQPLIAKPMAASVVVANKLGESHRERFVRWVTVKSGDSFDALAKRWCGSVQPYSEEAVSLNEDKKTLKIGDKVMVPWVDDEVLADIIERQELRPTAERGPATPNAAATPPQGMPRPSVSRPSFAMPRFTAPSDAEINGDTSKPTNTGSQDAGVGDATVSYKVKPNDNLWSISAKRYGRGKADMMVRVILDLNSGLTENLKIDQVIQLPAKAN